MIDPRLIYVAGPYSSPHPRRQSLRGQLHLRAVVYLLEVFPDSAVYSPVVHGRAVAHAAKNPKLDHAFWMQQCIPILCAASHIACIPMPGFESSRGTQEEVRLAKAANIPEVSTCSDIFEIDLDLWADFRKREHLIYTRLLEWERS